MLSNLSKNPNTWIRDIVGESGAETYTAWKRRIESLTHTFKTEISLLDDDFKSNFVVKDGQYPELISLFLQRKISLETASILTDITNVLGYWETNISDKVIAKDIIRSFRKYRPFLDINKNKFEKIIQEHFF